MKLLPLADALIFAYLGQRHRLAADLVPGQQAGLIPKAAYTPGTGGNCDWQSIAIAI